MVDGAKVRDGVRDIFCRGSHPAPGPEVLCPTTEQPEGTT